MIRISLPVIIWFNKDSCRLGTFTLWSWHACIHSTFKPFFCHILQSPHLRSHHLNLVLPLTIKWRLIPYTCTFFVFFNLLQNSAWIQANAVILSAIVWSYSAKNSGWGESASASPRLRFMVQAHAATRNYDSPLSVATRVSGGGAKTAICFEMI